MPIHVRQIEQAPVAHVSCEGKITLADVKGVMQDYFSQSAPPRPEAVVIDLTAATGLEITFHGMLNVVNTLARGLSLLMSRLRFIIIAPDSLSFGMARQFQQLASHVPWFEVSILPELDEATSLLDLEMEDLAAS